MAQLDLSPRICRPDDLYETLIDAHRGLDDAASMKLNAKLVLILANQIGDLRIVNQAIELAALGVARAADQELAA